MRLLKLTLLFSVVAAQSVLAYDIYDPQFHTLDTIKVVEIEEDSNGNEFETVVLEKKIPNEADELMGINKDYISSEELQRHLNRIAENEKKPGSETITVDELQRHLQRMSGKTPQKEEPRKEEPRKEEPKKPSTAETTSTKKPENSESVADDVIKITDKLIAIGKKLYVIVASGKPELSMSSSPISVVPTDENGKVVQPFFLENWNEPISKKFKVTIHNYMGIDVATFEYMVIFSYGGSYAGAGKYITSAQIKPTYVDVFWGFKFDVNCSLQSIMNRGTKENPVAAALLMVDYRIVSVLQERVMNKTFYVDGLGNMRVH